MINIRYAFEKDNFTDCFSPLERGSRGVINKII
jgi:hypothetical protein